MKEVNSASPIGVFDSGIGGLTVVRELTRQLPNESIIYFGDTARVPYGPKSPETVIRYSREITSFLRDQGVKAVVVACNTATAHALPTLLEEYDLPIIGVVEPGSRAAARATKTGNVGVIGTYGTIKSRAYERAIAREMPDANIMARACPLFVPLIEEGWLEGVDSVGITSGASASACGTRPAARSGCPVRTRPRPTTATGSAARR